MIRLLPIFHSWKCPGTGNLCSVTEDCFMERGEYKRGLVEQRSLRGLVYSRAGLFLSRAGLFWPHQWIPRISPNIKLCTTLSSLGEWLFTTQRRILGMGLAPSSETARCTWTFNEMDVFPFNLWTAKLPIRFAKDNNGSFMHSIKSTFSIVSSPNVSLMGQFSVKAPWIGLNRASWDHQDGYSSVKPGLHSRKLGLLPGLPQLTVNECLFRI